MREIATESGKVVLVPDEGALTGPMIDFTGEVEASRLWVFVPEHHIADQLKRAKLVLLSTGKLARRGFECVGEVASRTGRIVIADPHMLYGRSFGDRWVRPDEFDRAKRALNRRHRVGSEYPTDTGETAVAVRVSSKASRYGLSRARCGFELRVIVFHGDDEDWED